MGAVGHHLASELDDDALAIGFDRDRMLGSRDFHSDAPEQCMGTRTARVNG
jgi:hypothetical protein